MTHAQGMHFRYENAADDDDGGDAAATPGGKRRGSDNGEEEAADRGERNSGESSAGGAAGGGADAGEGAGASPSAVVEGSFACAVCGQKFTRSQVKNSHAVMPSRCHVITSPCRHVPRSDDFPSLKIQK